MDHALRALLAYRERDRFSSDPSRRPLIGRLNDDGGHSRFYMIPAPLHLAAVFATPLLGGSRELFRSADERILGRPIGGDGTPAPLDHDELVRELYSALRAIPERPWSVAHEAYTYVRTFAELAPSAELDRYARATIAALGRSRAGLPDWKAPRTPRPKSTKTAYDYVLDQRAREREDARVVVRKWVGLLAPGRYLLGEAYDDYTAAAERARTKLEALHPGALYVGRRAFYALLREAFEVIPGGGHRQYLVIPTPTEKEPSVNAIAAVQAEADAYRDAADQGERLLAIRERLAAGDRLGALDRGGYRLATGTDGAIVDLAAARATRR